MKSSARSHETTPKPEPRYYGECMDLGGGKELVTTRRKRDPNRTSPTPATVQPRKPLNLDVVEGAFAANRRKRAGATLHREGVAGALKMMSSEQLKAFDVSQESAELRRAYGDTPFGRGCLAARRLGQVSVKRLPLFHDQAGRRTDRVKPQCRRLKVRRLGSTRGKQRGRGVDRGRDKTVPHLGCRHVLLVLARARHGSFLVADWRRSPSYGLVRCRRR